LLFVATTNDSAVALLSMLAMLSAIIVSIAGSNAVGNQADILVKK
jgi:hypothetical protein